MEKLNATYFGDMFPSIQKTFEEINNTVQNNRAEIRDLAYKTHIDESE